jgi:hypothetical protein
MYGFESYEQQNISVQKLLPKIKLTHTISATICIGKIKCIACRNIDSKNLSSSNITSINSEKNTAHNKNFILRLYI